jgi:transglutaminase-like putative cysteine protease
VSAIPSGHAASPRAGRSPLPREARDTLFLLAIIAGTLLPHAGHLPWWCSAITAAVLGWRARLAWRSEALPGRWSLMAVLALVIGLTYLTHHTLLGREAGITMLAMLMALKTLELRARRDAFVVFFLGFFLVLTQFLYSQSPLVALWMLACVWALLSALVLAQMPQGVPSLKLAARIAARNTLIGVPVMLALFLLFPRLPPLWGLPKDAGARTGLSDTMSFGAFAEVANDDTIAMRLRFEGPPPAQPLLYFRAQVLSRFDGTTWTASRVTWGAPGRDPVPEGPPVRYVATLEPLRVSALPLLEVAPGATGATLQAGRQAATRGQQGQWLTPQPIAERLRLTLEAWPRARWGLSPSRAERNESLSLPAGLNPRAVALGAELRERFAALDDDARAEAVHRELLTRIRRDGFGYTLTPGTYGETTPNAVDEFWFDRRLGFCEHFAAAYVVLMRAAGVPARVVTGFQGADPRLQDGDLIVRMSQAHAWAEFWTSTRGWQRADPTAAVAPERVQGQPLRPPPGVFAGAMDAFSPGLLLELRGAWERLNNRWQQTVLNFSAGDQMGLLRRLGFEEPDWGTLAQIAGLLFAGLGVAGAAVAAWQRRPHDPWSRQRARVRRELARLGLETRDDETPRRWAERLGALHGDAAGALAAALLQLEAQRYRQDRTAGTSQWQRQFTALCAELRRRNA